MKKIVGLDLDEIFRSYIETFHHYYEKEFNLKVYNKKGEQVSGYNCEYNTNNIGDIFEFKEYIRKNKIIKSDIDTIYSSHIKYDNEEEFISKENALNIFRYEDYLIELYGTCPKTYTNVSLDLSKLVDKYQDEIEFKFLVKDKTITIGPSLFFISTMKPIVKKYQFVDTFEDVWDNCDIYVTANPDFITTKHDNKEIILKNMPYNKDFDVNYRINSLSDLLENNIINKILKK